MKITKGKIQSAQKVVLYGPEGIGKSTFAAAFPDPLFIDTEGSTKHLDVQRFDPPTSWAMVLEQVKYVVQTPGACKTLVLDTADWAEQMCAEAVCARNGGVKGLEDFGYGKGYTYLQEEFGRLLNALSEVVDRGIHVVITAHATMRKQELPDELGAFDRWELKLSKKVAAMVKEWADMVLFANYKTLVVNVDNQGAAKGKNKAQGGQRVMYTSHRPTWDAKNRHGLPDELSLEYAAIAHCFMDPLAELAKRTQELGASASSALTDPAPDVSNSSPASVHAGPTTGHIQASPASALQPVAPVQTPDFEEIVEAPAPPPPSPPAKQIHPQLAQLMQANGVTEFEIQDTVGFRGYFPENMPVADYPEDFVLGVLVGAWDKVHDIIKDRRSDLPF